MPSVTVSAITVDTKGLDETLKRLRKDQVPYAKQLSVNALAKDTIRIEKLEMLTIFDRPKPFVVGGLRQLKKAKKRDPTAVIGFTDLTGRFGNRTENIVRAHIEGEPRGTKAVESLLRYAGMLRSNEYIVHGRSAPLDRYGNITYARHKSMVKGLRDRTINARGGRYFISRAGRGRGIYVIEKKGERPKLLWYITTDRPDYSRRFDFYGLADRQAAKWGGYFAEEAMKKALATAR